MKVSRVMLRWTDETGGRTTYECTDQMSILREGIRPRKIVEHPTVLHQELTPSQENSSTGTNLKRVMAVMMNRPKMIKIIVICRAMLKFNKVVLRRQVPYIRLAVNIR